MWDKNHDFDYYCNMDMIELSLIEEKSRRDELFELISRHYRHTGSPLAKQMIEHWSDYIDDFIQVTPIEYKRVLHEEALRQIEKKMENVQQEENY